MHLGGADSDDLAQTIKGSLGHIFQSLVSGFAAQVQIRMPHGVVEALLYEIDKVLQRGVAGGERWLITSDMALAEIF